MTGILSPFAFARDGKRLTRVAASEDIHRSTPRVAIESSNVVPDRCRIQGRVFHPRHEGGRSIGFPLDVTHSAIIGNCDGEAEVDPAGACAERQAEEQVCGGGNVSGGM